MRIARPLTFALFLSGIAIGSLADRPDRRMPAMDAGYHVLAADFHVHAFPGDGTLAAWDLAREAARRQLDVIAITNHNQTRAGQWTAARSINPEVIVIPGEEVTAPTFHLAVIGIKGTLDWWKSVPALAGDAHAAGGAIILAHPTRQFAATFDSAALAAIDGIEAAHPLMHLDGRARRDMAAAYARAEGIHPTVSPIGSSDFHNFAPIGLCRTFVFARARTQAAVIDAVRHGRTVACDQNGRVTGQPALAAVAEPFCRAAALDRLEDSGSARLAKALTLAGLLGLALFAFPGARAA
jgi:hypothetical protein